MKNRNKTWWPGAILPLGFLGLELLLRYYAGLEELRPHTLLVPLVLGLGAWFLASLPGNPKWRFALTLIFLELSVLYYGLFSFLQGAFQTFLDPAILLTAAGDAMTDYSNAFLTTLRLGWPRMLLFHLPVILAVGLYPLLGATRKVKLRSGLILGLAALVVLGGGLLGLLLPK